MPLRLFKALLAQMANLNVMMVRHVARITMEVMVAVLFLRVFVVQMGLSAAAPMQTFAVGLPVAPMMKHVAQVTKVAALFLRVFVVKTGFTVAPMQPNVIYNMGAVSDHNFCLL